METTIKILEEIKQGVEARRDAAMKEEHEYSQDPQFKSLQNLAYGRKIAYDTVINSIETKIKLIKGGKYNE